MDMSSIVLRLCLLIGLHFSFTNARALLDTESRSCVLYTPFTNADYDQLEQLNIKFNYRSREPSDKSGASPNKVGALLSVPASSTPTGSWVFTDLQQVQRVSEAGSFPTVPYPVLRDRNEAEMYYLKCFAAAFQRITGLNATAVFEGLPSGQLQRFYFVSPICTTRFHPACGTTPMVASPEGAVPVCGNFEATSVFQPDSGLLPFSVNGLLPPPDQIADGTTRDEGVESGTKSGSNPVVGEIDESTTVLPPPVTDSSPPATPSQTSGNKKSAADLAPLLIGMFLTGLAVSVICGITGCYFILGLLKRRAQRAEEISTVPSLPDVPCGLHHIYGQTPVPPSKLPALGHHLPPVNTPSPRCITLTTQHLLVISNQTSHSRSNSDTSILSDRLDLFEGHEPDSATTHGAVRSPYAPVSPGSDSSLWLPGIPDTSLNHLASSTPLNGH